MSIDDDDAVVDVPEDRQDRNVRVRQSLLQAMPVDRVAEDLAVLRSAAADRLAFRRDELERLDASDITS